MNAYRLKICKHSEINVRAVEISRIFNKSDRQFFYDAIAYIALTIVSDSMNFY